MSVLFILFNTDFCFTLVNEEKSLFSILMSFGLSMEEMSASRSCMSSVMHTGNSSQQVHVSRERTSGEFKCN